jgi:anti-sigma regulatory factor (Ser/Thr protein kinase)
MLVAEAIGHTHAPVELTVDTHDDVIRVEVRDQGPAIPASVASMVGHGTLLWCELRDQPARPP